MPTWTMCKPDAPGAYLLEGSKERYGHEIWMREEHAGLVLEDREKNGYDDSDFYVVVWNEEKSEPEDVFYKTTRAWTYPNGARVDATPEIRAKYDAWLAEQRLKREIENAEHYAHRTADLADVTGLSPQQVMELEETYNPTRIPDLFKLLDSYGRGRLRSDFRKSLAKQVIEWLRTPKAKRAYPSPLSPRQLDWV